MITRDDFVNYALTLQGVQYRHQGRNEFGLDCLGIVVMCIQHFGFKGYQDNANYSPNVNGLVFKKALDEQAIVLLNKDAYQKGDMFLLEMNRQPQHIAIYIGGGKILHATQESGKVCVVGFDTRWQARHRFTYTLKEFASWQP